MKMTKNDLLKIEIDKDGECTIGLNGEPAVILSNLSIVTQSIIDKICSSSGVDTILIAQNYAKNAKKIITKNATDNIPKVNDMAKKMLTLIDEVLDSLEKERRRKDE